MMRNPYRLANCCEEEQEQEQEQDKPMARKVAENNSQRSEFFWISQSSYTNLSALRPHGRGSAGDDRTDAGHVKEWYLGDSNDGLVGHGAVSRRADFTAALSISAKDSCTIIRSVSEAVVVSRILEVVMM
jgi:hypothetical protein